MSNVAIYIRVSTEEQKKYGMSSAAQEYQLRHWADENHHIVVGVYDDSGYSGGLPYTKRPALKRLMNDIEKGDLDIRLIAFTKLDRWSRSPQNHYECLKILARHKVEWTAIHENFRHETPADEFMIDMALAAAKYERMMASARQKTNNEYRRARGDFVGGLAPFGYMIENKRLVKNPETGPIVEMVFGTYLATGSVAKAKEETEKAGIKFCRQYMYDMLRNPIYTGERDGYTCEAYITKEQHELIERMIMQRRRLPKKQDMYGRIFTGMIKCGECGFSCTGKTSMHKKIRYIYYNCNQRDNGTLRCSNGYYIREDRLEETLIGMIEEAMDSTPNPEEITSNNTKSNANDEIKQLNNKLERLKELYIDGDIEKASYTQRKAEIEAKMEALKNTLSESKNEPTIALPGGWRKVYEDLTRPNKAKFWLSIVETIYIHSDKHVTVKWKESE